ncbi:MAG: hypothetical protein AB8B91_16900 [Rubripirellula sp.]
MRMIRPALILLLLACAGNSTKGEEPARAFLDGLRSRGYNDVALDYLKSMQTSRLAPPELRQTIPYEIALTLVDSSRKERDMKVRFKTLDEAQALLKQFIDSQGSHPKAYAARSQLGNLIVERARIKVEQAKTGNRQALLKEARSLYDRSFKEFSALEEVVSKELETIPKVLDVRDKDQARQAGRRNQLRADNLQTELLSAAILEETADTVPDGSKLHIDYLTKAADRYDGIYKRYRSRLAGLYARMYQGRCNHRLGKTKDALGYYGELLDQPDTPDAFRILKTKALRLALESWMSPQEKKYAVAIKTASEWITTVPRTAERDPDMLAIRFGLARAYKMQADDLESREPRDARTIAFSIETAKKHAQFVANETGELREQAQEFVVALGGRARANADAEPETFADAQRAGKKLLDAIAPLRQVVAKLQKQVRQAKQADKAKLREELDTARLALSGAQNSALESYRLALTLADEDTAPSDVNLARYFLCYLYYLRQSYHEAALLGDLVSRRYPESAGAKECAKISLASYLQVLDATVADSKASGDESADTDFEIGRLISTARHTVETWPSGPEAIEAAATIVPLLVNNGEFDYAREFTTKIPGKSPKRGNAELVTGQAMWGKQLQLQQEVGQGLADGVDLEAVQSQIDQLAKQSVEFLSAGYKRLPEAPAVTTSNATALLSLAQAYVAEGKHVEALEVLNHPVLGPITLVEATNPVVENPVFVSEALRTSLQANVGSIGTGGEGAIAKAKAAMAAMQQAVGSDAAGKKRMLGIYVNLAQSVETQMKSAPDDAKQKLSQVFEAFLQELSAGSSDVGVINWVAETFASLGAGFEAEGEADVVNETAKTYYQRSVGAFQNLLSVSGLQPELVTQVKSRMASVKSKMGDYEGAMSDFQEILSKNPKAINLQVEAARLLQAWGKTDPNRLQQAIAGVDGTIWGWGKVASGTMQFPQFRDTFYEARYEMARCQLEQSKSKSGSEKSKLIASAARNLSMTKQLYPTLGGEKWTAAYDDLLTKLKTSK